MTLYKFKTYSGDNFIVLSDIDNLTVEETFRQFVPEEYYCWIQSGQHFSYTSFSRYIISDEEKINLKINYSDNYLDLSMMNKDVAYFSDSFQDFYIERK